LKLKLLYTLIFILFTLDLHAGFFSSLFEKNRQEPIITQEDPIIEEEVISAEEYIDSVEEPTDIEVFSDEPQSRAFDEDEEFYSEEDEDNPLVRSQSIFLSYIEQPEKIYLSEHVKIKIKAIITNENVNNIATSFLNGKNVKVLNPKSSWKKISNTTYENSYILKLFSTNAHLPDIKITTTSNSGRSQSETLASFNPKIIALREDKEFSLVLAKDLTLLEHHEKKYDEKTNIVVLEINATGSNLEDFHIPYATRDGIDEIKYNGDNQRIYYFAIIPNNIKIFKFKYFDLQSNKYNIVSFPIILQDSSVSTQTDLNPEESRYALYKAIALIMLAFIIFLFYLKSRKLYLLLFSMIVLAFTFYIKMPMSKIVLQKGVKLRILPTKNSTIFYITESKINADKLLVRDNYIKVLLPDKKIGWIDENSAKN
jgi:hypothetical protein